MANPAPRASYDQKGRTYTAKSSPKVYRLSQGPGLQRPDSGIKHSETAIPGLPLGLVVSECFMRDLTFEVPTLEKVNRTLGLDSTP